MYFISYELTVEVLDSRAEIFLNALNPKKSRFKKFSSLSILPPLHSISILYPPYYVFCLIFL